MRPPETKLAPRGLSLIEVLVTIAIIGILIALLLPTLVKARARASRIACISNQKQVATALLLYAQSDPEERLPFNNAVGTNAVQVSYHLLIGEYARGPKALFWCPADTFSFFGTRDDDVGDGRPVFEWLGTSYGFNAWMP